VSAVGIEAAHDGSWVALGIKHDSGDLPGTTLLLDGIRRLAALEAIGVQLVRKGKLVESARERLGRGMDRQDVAPLRLWSLGFGSDSVRGDPAAPLVTASGSARVTRAGA
jgi:hypothetical protein